VLIKGEDSAMSNSMVHSGGGATIGGNVNTGGDFVGRDKYVGYTTDQVSGLLSQISTTFQPRPFDGRCPYVGLAAFDEQDADRFF
jgi:hypothetical protein